MPKRARRSGIGQAGRRSSAQACPFITHTPPGAVKPPPGTRPNRVQPPPTYDCNNFTRHQDSAPLGGRCEDELAAGQAAVRQPTNQPSDEAVPPVWLGKLRD